MHDNTTLPSPLPPEWTPSRTLLRRRRAVRRAGEQEVPRDVSEVRGRVRELLLYACGERNQGPIHIGLRNGIWVVLRGEATLAQNTNRGDAVCAILKKKVCAILILGQSASGLEA